MSTRIAGKHCSGFRYAQQRLSPRKIPGHTQRPERHNYGCFASLLAESGNFKIR
jgi:hypothetical protein